jgi:hypothetical protein
MMKAGSTMFARAASQIVRRHCGCCGDELSAHQALSSGICEKPRCREWKIAKVGAELLERRRRETLERLFSDQAPVVARAAAAIGATPGTVVRATIPWQGRPVEPLPEARRAAFAEHLGAIVAEAFAGPVPQDDLSARAELEQDESPLTGVACAACRGQCCRRGGTAAFLQAADIARWRQREPGATAEEIAGWYLGMLPAETIAEACVFQAAKGCALPRDRRNDACNRYHCESLEALRARIADLGGKESDHKVVMIVDDAAADEARGVVGWSAATGPVGFVATPPAPASPSDA